jgi:dihydrofolate reductase
MGDVLVWVFLHSLDGLLADQGTEYWDYAFGLPDDPAMLDQKLEVYRRAEAHVMGRVSYESIGAAMRAATDHPFSELLTSAPKVVFSRTLATADWANTTIAAGDTTDEIDRLRRRGDGPIVVWGGIRLWRSLIELDLVDEFRIDLFPYVAGEGTRLFDGFPRSYRLELVSSTPFSNGVVSLRYRRPR